MRDLLQIGLSRERARMDDLARDKETAAEKFAAYLQHYRPKTRRTRHGLLGPVAEVIKLAAKPLMTSGQATGRALRMHEMAQEGRPVSDEATKALEDAVSTFFALIARCPVHLRRMISDRVLDHVYLLVRKADQAFWDGWRAWLHTKYVTVEHLNIAWVTSYDAWEKVRLKRESEVAQADFEQFKKDRQLVEEVTPDLIGEEA